MTANNKNKNQVVIGGGCDSGGRAGHPLTTRVISVGSISVSSGPCVEVSLGMKLGLAPGLCKRVCQNRPERGLKNLFSKIHSPTCGILWPW